MANLLETLKNTALQTSIRGRRLGLTQDDYLVGVKDLQKQVEDISSTAASTISAFGFTRLMSTAASSAIYTVAQHVAGIEKRIAQTSSSTLGFAVRFPSGTNVYTTAGTSFNQLVFAGAGNVVALSALSSAILALVGTLPSGVTASTF